MNTFKAILLSDREKWFFFANCISYLNSAKKLDTQIGIRLEEEEEEIVDRNFLGLCYFH